MTRQCRFELRKLAYMHEVIQRQHAYPGAGGTVTNMACPVQQRRPVEGPQGSLEGLGWGVVSILGPPSSLGLYPAVPY